MDEESKQQDPHHAQEVDLTEDIEETLRQRHEQKMHDRAEAGKGMAGAAGAAALWGGCLLYAMLPLTFIVAAILIIVVVGIFTSR